MNINVNGMSQFFWFAIPAVLALATIWWLAFGEGLHYFRRALSQEQRHAEIVRAKILPKKPIEIVIDDSRDAAIVVDRAEIDGGDLWVYYKNISSARVCGIDFTWKLIAPDGTVIKSKWGYADISGKGADCLEPGERAEMHLKIEADPRAVKLNIKMRK